MAVGGAFSIAGLVRELAEPLPLSPPFMSALAQLDEIAVSSALAMRLPLARLVVANPALLERNFSRHSVAELATSRTLHAVASKMKATQLRTDLQSHAADEERHSRMFEALANGVGKSTGQRNGENYEWILENDERFVAHYNGDVIEFVCYLFAAEVRTYSFLASYVDALAGCSFSDADKIGRVLSHVLDDERRHVGYTSRYINQWMGQGLDLSPSLHRSCRDFNRNSWIEVAETSRFFCERE